MDKARPFAELKEPRNITIQWLPKELRTFYTNREGGPAGTSEADIWLYRLDQLSLIKWKDLEIFGRHEPKDGWKDFSGIRIGHGSYGDEIVVVLSAPSAPRGSVIAFGPDVSGPGGNGENKFLPSLVLSDDFDKWIARLAQDGWVEYGLVPGGIKDLAPDRQRELRAQFLRLNPGISWAK